jgi:glutamate carboxypeptidase
MLFTADEEVGSTTSRALLEERAVACGAVLVLEPAADGGAVKTGRKGTGTFEVVVRGRAAHAGLEPELGVNALVEASRQVLAIAELGDPARGTTVTPTMAVAGTADNVVPAEARVRVDVRVTGAEERERIEAAMAGLVAVDPQATVEVLGSIGRPPMPESASATLFPLARRVVPDLVGVAVGGGSDGNFTAALGVPTLDGLGAVGGGAHADHEHVVVDTMVPRVRLVTGVLRELL